MATCLHTVQQNTAVCRAFWQPESSTSKCRLTAGGHDTILVRCVSYGGAGGVAEGKTAELLLGQRCFIRANHYNTYRPRAACFCPAGSGLSVVSACAAPPSPRHWPHFAEGSPHRIAHTGGRVDWTLNTSILQSAWVTPTICGHLAAVWITQWIVITVALWWVPPPTVGAIAGWVVGFRCRIQTEQRCLVGRYANKDVQVRRPGLQVYRP